MRKNHLLGALFLVFNALLTNPSFAGNTTATTKATALLAGGCIMQTHTINFGTMTPSTSGSLYSTSSVDLICSKGMTYNVILSSGNGSPGSVASNGYGVEADNGTSFIRTSNPIFTTNVYSSARIMNGTKSSDYLIYNLYMDSAHTQAFIDSAYVTRTGTGTNDSVPIYAKLRLQQYITPDNYTQTVVVTISY